MKNLTAILFLLVSSISLAQTTTQDGDYEVASNWTPSGIPGSFSGSTYTINGLSLSINYLNTLGSSSTTRNMSAPTNANSTLTIHDTFVIYGDLTINQDGMDIDIKANGRLIVMGNMTTKNNTSIASGGLLVVKGQLKMDGGSATYTAENSTAAVYAGSYGGQSESKIDDGSTSTDKSFLIEDLDDDGFTEEYDLIFNDTPLPITLGSFNLKSQANHVAITWTTLSEENFDYFEIQRAGANGKFEVIATVNGNGWSSEVVNYSYVDETPLAGLNMYRLESVDFDGYRETFPAKAINLEMINKAINFYPNVLHGKSEVQLDYSGEVFVRVIDIKGAIAFESSVSEGQFELPALPSGQYILKYRTEENYFGITKLCIKP